MRAHTYLHRYTHTRRTFVCEVPQQEAIALTLHHCAWRHWDLKSRRGLLLGIPAAQKGVGVQLAAFEHLSTQSAYSP